MLVNNVVLFLNISTLPHLFFQIYQAFGVPWCEVSLGGRGCKLISWNRVVVLHSFFIFAVAETMRFAYKFPSKLTRNYSFRTEFSELRVLYQNRGIPAALKILKFLKITKSRWKIF